MHECGKGVSYLIYVTFINKSASLIHQELEKWMDCAKISSFLRPGGVCLSLRLHTAQHILSSLVAILALSHSPPDREHNYFVIRIARTHIHQLVSHKIPAFKSPPRESSLPNANSEATHCALLRDTIKIEREIGGENIAYEIDLHLFGEPEHGIRTWKCFHL
jgi:hypothetical protein